MCKYGDTTLVKVKIPADLSHTGKAYWKKVGIDKCIAPIVRALQKGSIDMRGSCCGHGENNGFITLDDKRVLIIKNIEDSKVKANIEKKEKVFYRPKITKLYGATEKNEVIFDYEKPLIKLKGA